jgi:hypothetical protein
MDRLESLVEKQIREAQEQGEFDNLPGAGKPLRGIDAGRDDRLRASEPDLGPATGV